MISVIIPIYNKKKYIKRIIDVLKEQTYKDIEAIFIDDGSTDGSYKIAKSYENGKNIFVYKQKNQGVSVARNLGILHAKGNWISFLDPDDFVVKTYFEELIKFEKNYDIISCCCYAISDNRKVINNFFSDNRDFSGKKKRILFRQLLDDTYDQPGKTYTAIGVPWGKLYKKSLILDNNIKFNTKLKKMEDNMFNMHAFQCAHNIYYLNKPLYFYSINHIKNDYISNFDSYALKNIIELQKARVAFFEENKYLLDRKTKFIFGNATVSLLISMFNKFLLNKENNQTYWQKKLIYLNLIKLHFFYEIIHALDIFKVNGIVHKIVAFSMKYKLFCPIKFIWCFREVYVKIKYKEYTN